MSQPDPIGAIGQLLLGSKQNPADYLGWHEFVLERPADKLGEAGRWCMSMIQGSWTFKTEYKRITFYIKDASDAMLFKLTWGGQ